MSSSGTLPIGGVSAFEEAEIKDELEESDQPDDGMGGRSPQPNEGMEKSSPQPNEGMEKSSPQPNEGMEYLDLPSDNVLTGNHDLELLPRVGTATNNTTLTTGISASTCQDGGGPQENTEAVDNIQPNSTMDDPDDLDSNIALSANVSTFVNGTSSQEGYFDCPQNHNNVVNNCNQTTDSIDICRDIDEVTSSEDEELQSNITTQPPEIRPQGIPHGGWLYSLHGGWLYSPHGGWLYSLLGGWLYSPHGVWLYSPHGGWLYSLHGGWLYSLHGGWLYSLHGGWLYSLHGGWLQLRNTCNLDQFLNGLYQICRFTPIRNELEELARRFPQPYEHLWTALLLCEEGRFTEAKILLVPAKFDMHNCEGLQIMPLIEQQLAHQFTSDCLRCGGTDVSSPVTDVCLSAEHNVTQGFQEALRTIFSRPNGRCSQPSFRCDGRTTVRAEFRLGIPPMFLAINLYSFRHLIQNPQHINFGEIVELFGGRYMLFLFTLARPDSEEHGRGHYMSYVFRPDEGRELDRDGRPVGKWYFFPNDRHGTLEPWTAGRADPEGSFPSYVYFVRIPPSSSGVATTSSQEDDGPRQEDNVNEE